MNEVAEKAKPSKKLLYIATGIFIAEFVGIIGWYWLFGGKAGDISLTISRYVGLNWCSALIFCGGNLAISVLLVYHLVTQARDRGFLWRFLMYGVVLTLIALSVSPHMPDHGMSSVIHRIFAGTMFVIMGLIGLLTALKSNNKLTTIVAILFTTYAIYFCVSDALRVPYFMDAVFIFESVYLYGFFGLLLLSD